MSVLVALCRLSSTSTWKQDEGCGRRERESAQTDGTASGEEPAARLVLAVCWLPLGLVRRRAERRKDTRDEKAAAAGWKEEQCARGGGDTHVATRFQLNADRDVKETAE